jgi:4-azaleucine resistance transporter AzlC
MATGRSYVGQALTIGVATGFFGISFGVLATGNGLTVLQTCAMSALVFTGASQFAAVGVVAAGGAPVTAVVSGLLLGIRNAAYGLAMAPRFPRRILPRVLCTHILLDESTALALSVPEEDKMRAFVSVGLSIVILWNLGTLIGAVAGANIADPAALGLDAALPASILALVAPRLSNRAGLRTALIGAIIALALTPLLPAGLPIIVASAAIVPELLRKDET